MKLLLIIASNVKYYRKLQNLSQENLADISSLHRTYVGCIERAEKNITILNLEKIANALNISIAELLKENNNG